MITEARAATQTRVPRGSARIAPLLGATLLHTAILMACLLRPMPAYVPASGTFGGAVAVTLTPGPPSPRSDHRTATTPSLASLERRLSTSATTQAAPPPASTSSPPSGSLSQMLGENAGDAPNTGAKQAGADLLASSDDPYARASVSFRGDDPAKATNLKVQATRCAKRFSGARLLLLIDSKGRLVGQPRLVSGLTPDRATAVAAALERCGPFETAASPGAPRSYEIQID